MAVVIICAVAFLVYAQATSLEETFIEKQTRLHEQDPITYPTIPQKGWLTFTTLFIVAFSSILLPPVIYCLNEQTNNEERDLNTNCQQNIVVYSLAVFDE